MHKLMDPDQLQLFNLERISQSLDYYSDVEIMQSKKYNTSSFLDRSDLQIFPDVYVEVIASRVNAISKGVSFQDILENAKRNGFRNHFQPITRPKIFDLRCLLLL